MTEQERQDAKLRARRQLLFVEESEFFDRLQETRDRIFQEYSVAQSDYSRLFGEDDEAFKISCQNIHFSVREVLWRLEKLAAEITERCANIRNDLGPCPFSDDEEDDEQ